jgi:hypothetical protein
VYGILKLTTLAPPTGAGFALSAISNRDDSERKVWDKFWEAGGSMRPSSSTLRSELD